jgi:hypothetical protein
VQEHLGGDLLLAEVRYADGSPQGLHYWNRLPDGTELDVVARPPDLTRGRLYPQYQALSRAVRAGLPE